MNIKSAFLKLGKSDLVKGCIMTALGAIAGTAYAAIQAGTLLDLVVLKGMASTALATGGTYLLKNLFTNSNGQIGPEPPKQ